MAQDREKEIAEKTALLQSEEAVLRKVHDRSIGGPMALRPSEKFIRDNTGPLKTDKQLAEDARRIVDTKHERQAQQVQADHETGIAARERGVETARDRMRSEGRGSMRDTLRNNRNGRDGIER